MLAALLSLGLVTVDDIQFRGWAQVVRVEQMNLIRVKALYGSERELLVRLDPLLKFNKAAPIHELDTLRALLPPRRGLLLERRNPEVEWNRNWREELEPRSNYAFDRTTRGTITVGWCKVISEINPSLGDVWYWPLQEAFDRQHKPWMLRID